MANNLSEEQIAEIRTGFDAFERQGVISTTDLRAAIKSLGQDPPPHEIERILREVDSKGGQVNVNYFITIMGGLIGEGDSEEDLVQAFAIFDKYDEGTISVDDFRHAMTNLGEGLPSQEVERMLQVGGVQHDRLDYRAWVKAMLAS